MCLHLKTQAWFYRLLRRTAATEERGAELAEAAVVLPLLVMLLLGIVTFARAYNASQTITRAAREGARFAVTPTCASCGNTFPTQAAVLTVVNAALLASSLDPSQVNGFSMQRGVVLNPGSTPQELGVVISFSYPFQFFLPFTPIHLTTISLSTAVQMREEI